MNLYTNTTVNTQLENRPNDKSLTVRKDIEYIIIIKSAVCCKQTKTINELNKVTPFILFMLKHFFSIIMRDAGFQPRSPV